LNEGTYYLHEFISEGAGLALAHAGLVHHPVLGSLPSLREEFAPCSESHTNTIVSLVEKQGSSKIPSHAI
jgi:hypothetical protein